MLNAECSAEYGLLGGGENSLKKRMMREPDSAQRRGYFNINHLSNILTGFKNPILSILPLSAGGDYQPPCCPPPPLPKLTERQTGTDAAFSSTSSCSYRHHLLGLLHHNTHPTENHPSQKTTHNAPPRDPNRRVGSGDARRRSAWDGEVKEAAVDEKRSHQYCMEARSLIPTAPTIKV